MATLVARCPVTGLKAQFWVEEETDPAREDEETFEAALCPACRTIHFVNPKTGHVLGAEDE